MISSLWRVVERKRGVLEVIKFAGPSGHQEKAVSNFTVNEDKFIKEGEHLV